MKRALVILTLLLISGCKAPGSSPVPTNSGGASLPQARKGFVTKLTGVQQLGKPVPPFPFTFMRLVKYPAPSGAQSAYLGNPGDGRRHPAIVWITGGDSSTIDESLWQPGPPDNDQSASAFREAGIVTMFPSLRGGNDNPGRKEGFLGEVDDVIAAADYLAQQPSVDPQHIYLGGHSTGGTLALLTAECTNRFRAVFSFGPVGDVSGYGPEYLPFDTSNPKEIELRSPGYWLKSVHGPTYVFEGANAPGNAASVDAMAAKNPNPQIRFYLVPGVNHFSILHPVTRIVAKKINADSGATCNIDFTDADLSGLGR